MTEDNPKTSNVVFVTINPLSQILVSAYTFLKLFKAAFIQKEKNAKYDFDEAKMP